MTVSGKRLEKNTRNAIGITRNICEACLDSNVTTVADGVCKECKEYMCNTCFQHHLKARQCRHHVLVDIDSSLVLEKDETCEQHTNEFIKYYCSSHDRVGCGDCMVLEHGDCKTDFIENFSKNFEEKEEFKVTVQQLESWEFETKFHENKLKGDKKKINTSHENALKKIRLFKTNMIERFDEAESIILAEVDALNFEYDTLLEKLGEDLKALSSNIKRAKFRISTDNYRGKTLFVQFTQNKPEIVKIKQTLEQIKLDHDVSGFEFQPDEQLVDFLSSNRSFGSLVNISRPDTSEDFVQYADDKAPEDDESAEDDESTGSAGDYKTAGDDKTAEDDESAETVVDDKTEEDDKTVKVENETGPICIGARVCPLPDCTLGRLSHNKEPGTIEHVECGGIITVKWDYSGQVKYGYRIGKSKCGNGIKLI